MLEKPDTRPYVMLAPAEWLDFSDRNVGDRPKLATIPLFSEKLVNNTNAPLPIALSMGRMSARINGRSFSMLRATKEEQVELGSYKVTDVTQ